MKEYENYLKIQLEEKKAKLQQKYADPNDKRLKELEILEKERDLKNPAGELDEYQRRSLAIREMQYADDQEEWLINTKKDIYDRKTPAALKKSLVWSYNRKPAATSYFLPKYSRVGLARWNPATEEIVGYEEVNLPQGITMGDVIEGVNRANAQAAKEGVSGITIEKAVRSLVGRLE